MIPLPGIRDKGSGPQLGARQPGGQGPFGEWPDPDEDEADEDDPRNACPSNSPSSDFRPSTRGRPTRRRRSTVTTIEWTNETWNPSTGCDRISPGCDNCYALPMAKRIKAMEQARGTKHPKYQTDGDPRTSGPGFGLAVHPDTLGEPTRWRTPRRVFVNSMSDLFHARVPVAFITDVWRTMQDTPQHTYQVLTKRPERLARVLDQVHRALNLPEPLANVWLGTSIESDAYVRRADALRQAPAAVRFISAEPLLGPLPSLDVSGVDWVILGGESGPGARPLELDWIRDVIGQCRTAGAAPFVKQLGTVWAKANGAADKKGGTPEDWPADLRVREYPAAV